MLIAADPNRLLIEADQISAAITAAETYMATLATKRTEIFSALEMLTRPALAPSVQERIYVQRGFVYLGDTFKSPTYLAIYRSVLSRLWKSFPEKHEAMAREVSRSAYSRRYIAQNRMDLFPGMSEEWTIQHSGLLCDGWYVDTNVNKKQIQKILSRAVEVAGLKWGQDICVYWDTRFIRASTHTQSDLSVRTPYVSPEELSIRSESPIWGSGR